MNTRRFLISTATTIAMLGLMVCPVFAAEGDDTVETETIVITEKNAELTLNDATIDMTNAEIPGSAIEVKEDASLTLEIVGENNLTGSAGYAGISVELGGSLTITGSGVLNVYGGDGMGSNDDIRYSGSGAGIGGNGNVVRTTGLDTDIDPSCGEININLSEGGVINAYGGDSTTANAGAGAGIGSGGGSGSSDGVFEPEGTITISNGTVNAYGGNNNAGGAGIGTGGYGNYGTVIGYVTVNVTGGTVKAEGGNEAAGIGGGSNVTSSAISISDGDITAIGGDDGDGSSWGGAGIGGGDNGGALGDITISGATTDITATGGGSAAGIGGGHNGQVDRIVINASTVHAYGGTSDSGAGAGIGSGGRGSAAVYTSGFDITLGENATVTAVGGAGAQGLGVGTNPNQEELGQSKLSIEDTVTLVAVAQDLNGNAVTAFWGINDDGSLDSSFDDSPIHLIWYTGENAQFGKANELYDYALTDNAYDWTYADGKITITDNGETVATVTYPIADAETVDSWAVTLND